MIATDRPRSAFTDAESFWTFAASLEPLASALICEASCVSAVLRAEPEAFSAPFSAARSAAIFSAASPCERSSWSRYARDSAKLAGHTIFGWPCAFR